MNCIVAFKHLKGNCVQERFGLAKEKSVYRIRLILVLYVYILIASRAVKEKKKSAHFAGGKAMVLPGFPELEDSIR